MILKRKAYQKLIDWKHGSDGTSALVLKGVRYAGKSFLCQQFGMNEYKSVIHIDFENISPSITDVFENESTDLDLFFTKLSAYHKVRLYKRQSLIIFDEVQQSPIARRMIKTLVADGRYDYIATASLLSAHDARDIALLSTVEQLEIFPLDFEEFLWAMDDELTIPLIQYCFEYRIALGQALHRKVMNDFSQYMLIGGMPQAVAGYIAEKDFAAADAIKKRILALYRNDISKYSGGYSRKVTAIFNAIPGQLSKKEKKYKLSSLNKNARQRSYIDAFMWLDDTMTINPCFNTTEPDLGLALSGDHSSQKLYMADTGLLVTHAFRGVEYVDNELYRAVLFDKLNVNAGMLMENMAAQMLRCNGHDLYFYSRTDTDNRQNMMEIDFLIANGLGICPVEVKSSEYRMRSSIDKFRNKFPSVLGEAYILHPKDLMIKEGVVHLPLYMAMFL